MMPTNRAWITDPAWTTRIVRKLLPLERVAHPQEMVGISKASEILFTISLGEAFKGYCYKLVAAIVVLPTPLNATRSVQAPRK